jgi:hypothetical protein
MASNKGLLNLKTVAQKIETYCSFSVSAHVITVIDVIKE